MFTSWPTPNANTLRAAGTPLGDVREPLGRLFADRGQAVREEEHDRQSPPSALQAERLVERAADVGAAVRDQAVHPSAGPIERGAARWCIQSLLCARTALENDTRRKRSSAERLFSR